MKIAVTSKGTELHSEVDPRFGRASYILIINPETLNYEVLDNKANINALRGAGIQAASMISDKGAEVLLTGYCGPKAFTTLKAANIKVFSDITGTINEAVISFNKGNLENLNRPNVDAHW